MTKTWNRYNFGLGTIGRDMMYSLVSMYLMFYLTDILTLPNKTIWVVSMIIMGARIFDALNDPIMGVIVDNTKTRFGKFKPWIIVGGLAAAVFTILLFTDFSLQGSKYVLLFSCIYVLWGISFTANDISYWSMLPALSMDQKEREKIGAFARICANIGIFSLVALIVPITNALGKAFGSMKQAYFLFSIGIVLFMLLFQLFTLFGVQEEKSIFKKEKRTTIKGMFKAIFQNDQLLVTAISMALFMIGYITTTSFGLYFFKYAFGNKAMYSVFAIVLGASQIVALSIFPVFSKKFTRKALYRGATLFVLAGYILFFFSPMNMVYIAVAGVLLFLGQAFIQLLMLMFLADTVEYGQWKLGKRNESVTFAIQPFINKMGGAVASGIVGATVVISGINDAASHADVSSEGLLILKSSMLLLPLICIVIGYVIYRTRYKISADFFGQIVSELKARGDIKESL